MAKYFSKLPIISYANTFARNLLTRVSFSDQTKANYNIFYPYTMKEEERRADILSSKYYDNDDYAWLIYLTNEVIDPYYDLGLSDYDFQNFIIKKYGSIASAQQQIVFFRNDWVNDESILSVDQYSSLSVDRKKYYTSILGYSNQISGYERKKEDWVTSTNKILEIAISPNSDVLFSIGESISEGESNAVVSYSNSSVLTVKHVFGSFSNTITSSSTSANVISSTLISESIPDDEISFWSPVYAYDDENEKNQSKRTIQLLDNRYLSTVEDEIRDLLE